MQTSEQEGFKAALLDVKTKHKVVSAKGNSNNLYHINGRPQTTQSTSPEITRPGTQNWSSFAYRAVRSPRNHQTPKSRGKRAPNPELKQSSRRAPGHTHTTRDQCSPGEACSPTSHGRDTQEPAGSGGCGRQEPRRFPALHPSFQEPAPRQRAPCFCGDTSSQRPSAPKNPAGPLCRRKAGPPTSPLAGHGQPWRQRRRGRGVGAEFPPGAPDNQPCQHRAGPGALRGTAEPGPSSPTTDSKGGLDPPLIQRSPKVRGHGPTRDMKW